ncbi:hypothetical protein J2S19_002564 [Metabacillus malikii]|uniref:Uncharacterized protein n=1 Tax=Metabacillus malikii TaxID=1504265 RepID=A0ABT9ZG73_9BACI|nr:hypothetical protein [Metabacillus malikii]
MNAGYSVGIPYIDNSVKKQKCLPKAALTLNDYACTHCMISKKAT